MGSKRQREIRGGETYSAAMILSRIGYDIALHFLKPTAMVLRQSLHLPCAPGRPRPALESAGWWPHLGARSCHASLPRHLGGLGERQRRPTGRRWPGSRAGAAAQPAVHVAARVVERDPGGRVLLWLCQ